MRIVAGRQRAVLHNSSCVAIDMNAIGSCEECLPYLVTVDWQFELPPSERAQQVDAVGWAMCFAKSPEIKWNFSPQSDPESPSLFNIEHWKLQSEMNRVLFGWFLSCFRNLIGFLSFQLKSDFSTPCFMESWLPLSPFACWSSFEPLTHAYPNGSCTSRSSEPTQVRFAPSYALFDLNFVIIVNYIVVAWPLKSLCADVIIVVLILINRPGFPPPSPRGQRREHTDLVSRNQQRKLRSLDQCTRRVSES